MQTITIILNIVIVFLIKVFDNIPPLNDRDKNIQNINELLEKLGFNTNNVVNNL